MTRTTNPAGLDLIKRFEGLRLRAYKCPAGRWTIGYGHTAGAHEGQEITEAEAERLLREDLIYFEGRVAALTQGLDLNDNEFSALVSFAFNLGEGALARSTLLKKLRANDTTGAADEFGRWVYAGGRVLQGLIHRRLAERELFLTCY